MSAKRKAAQAPVQRRNAVARKGRKTPAKAAEQAQLPVLYKPMRRTAMVAGMAALGALIGIGAWVTDLPSRLWHAGAATVASLGLEVRTVELSGLAHASRLDVYSAALQGRSNAMVELDVAAVRARLLELPWVADAAVTRRWPDTLAINIIERTPAAFWESPDGLVVIDREGQVLDRHNLDRFGQLTVIKGAGADIQVRSLWAMLARHPELDQRITQAELVSGRRWDLWFASGEQLVLPEGYDEADRALRQFTRVEAEDGVLNRGYKRFDLRDEKWLVIERREDDRADPSDAVRTVPVRATGGAEVTI